MQEPFAYFLFAGMIAALLCIFAAIYCLWRK